MIQLDHLVYAVPDLELACTAFAAASGVEPVIGGRHLLRGTHNALVRIGESSYLEFLAPDPEADPALRPRWMGIDALDGPAITRWCVRTSDLEGLSRTIQTVNPALGEISEGQRTLPDGRELRWRMTLPLATPKVHLLPFGITWADMEAHPTQRLERGCALEQLDFVGPDGAASNHIFRELRLGENYAVAVAKEARILVTLRTPLGLVRL